ncbi:MAG: hypothetical protein OXB87_02315, partial [Hyphomicrobiales bacterium]|nr:hypothetical protein [Hyphomicrobiales bacterium]
QFLATLPEADRTNANALRQHLGVEGKLAILKRAADLGALPALSRRVILLTTLGNNAPGIYTVRTDVVTDNSIFLDSDAPQPHIVNPNTPRTIWGQFFKEHLFDEDDDVFVHTSVAQALQGAYIGAKGEKGDSWRHVSFAKYQSLTQSKDELGAQTATGRALIERLQSARPVAASQKYVVLPEDITLNGRHFGAGIYLVPNTLNVGAYGGSGNRLGGIDALTVLPASQRTALVNALTRQAGSGTREFAAPRLLRGRIVDGSAPPPELGGPGTAPETVLAALKEDQPAPEGAKYVVLPQTVTLGGREFAAGIYLVNAGTTPANFGGAGDVLGDAEALGELEGAQQRKLLRALRDTLAYAEDVGVRRYQLSEVSRGQVVDFDAVPDWLPDERPVPGIVNADVLVAAEKAIANLPDNRKLVLLPEAVTLGSTRFAAGIYLVNANTEVSKFGGDGESGLEILGDAAAIGTLEDEDKNKLRRILNTKAATASGAGLVNYEADRTRIDRGLLLSGAHHVPAALRLNLHLAPRAVASPSALRDRVQALRPAPSGTKYVVLPETIRLGRQEFVAGIYLVNANNDVTNFGGSGNSFGDAVAIGELSEAQQARLRRVLRRRSGGTASTRVVPFSEAIDANTASVTVSIDRGLMVDLHAPPQALGGKQLPTLDQLFALVTATRPAPEGKKYVIVPEDVSTVFPGSDHPPGVYLADADFDVTLYGGSGNRLGSLADINAALAARPLDFSFPFTLLNVLDTSTNSDARPTNVDFYGNGVYIPAGLVARLGDYPRLLRPSRPWNPSELAGEMQRRQPAPAGQRYIVLPEAVTLGSTEFAAGIYLINASTDLSRYGGAGASLGGRDALNALAAADKTKLGRALRKRAGDALGATVRSYADGAFISRGLVTRLDALPDFLLASRDIGERQGQERFFSAYDVRLALGEDYRGAGGAQALLDERTGPQGLKGLRGEKGAPGEQGDQGPRGERGTANEERGDRGPDALAALHGQTIRAQQLQPLIKQAFDVAEDGSRGVTKSSADNVLAVSLRASEEDGDFHLYELAGASEDDQAFLAENTFMLGGVRYLRHDIPSDHDKVVRAHSPSYINRVADWLATEEGLERREGGLVGTDNFGLVALAPSVHAKFVENQGAKGEKGRQGDVGARGTQGPANRELRDLLDELNRIQPPADGYEYVILEQDVKAFGLAIGSTVPAGIYLADSGTLSGSVTDGVVAPSFAELTFSPTRVISTNALIPPNGNDFGSLRFSFASSVLIRDGDRFTTLDSGPIIIFDEEFGPGKSAGLELVPLDANGILRTDISGVLDAQKLGFAPNSDGVLGAQTTTPTRTQLLDNLRALYGEQAGLRYVVLPDPVTLAGRQFAAGIYLVNANTDASRYGGAGSVLGGRNAIEALAAADQAKLGRVLKTVASPTGLVSLDGITEQRVRRGLLLDFDLDVPSALYYEGVAARLQRLQPAPAGRKYVVLPESVTLDGTTYAAGVYLVNANTDPAGFGGEGEIFGSAASLLALPEDRRAKLGRALNTKAPTASISVATHDGGNPISRGLVVTYDGSVPEALRGPRNLSQAELLANLKTLTPAPDGRKYVILPETVTINEKTFLAGIYLVNASTNIANFGGEGEVLGDAAALAALEDNQRNKLARALRDVTSGDGLTVETLSGEKQDILRGRVAIFGEVRGVTGQKGSQGPQGPKGEVGDQGATGATGDASTTPGAAGDKGEKGVQGIRGEQGAPVAASGASGASASFSSIEEET